MNTDTGDIYRNPQAIEDARARGEPIVEVSELVARKMDLANEVKRLADEIERLQPPSPIDTSHGDLLREIAKLPGHHPVSGDLGDVPQ